MNKRKPSYYTAPLKSRTAIADFLRTHGGYHRNRGHGSPLAWGVKAWNVDLDFDHLVEVYRTSGEYGPDEGWLDNPDFLTPARAAYERVADNLFDWAIETARGHVTDGDTYVSLWDGTVLDVKYDFAGRSGGWLVMAEFNGCDLTRMSPDDFTDHLEDMDYDALRHLYQLVIQNDHDFRPAGVKAEVEHQAAFTFFENSCAGIPRPDATQMTLSFT